MNPGDPHNITHKRQRYRDREEELEDIDLGNREYQFEKGKETMADDDKIAFNGLISAIKELTTGKKEMMSTFRQMTEKNGPTPHSPLFPNSDRVSTSSRGSTYIATCRAIPIYTSLSDLPCLNS